MKAQRACLAGLVLMCASLGLAQTQQDALDVLTKVGENYQSLRTLQAEGDVTTGMNGPGMQQKMASHLRLILAPPSKMHMESQVGAINIIVISDGQTLWMYMPMLNKYSKLPLNGSASGAGASIAGGPSGIGGLPDFAKIAEGIKEARILRSEALQLDGVATDCYVILIVHRPSHAAASAQGPANAAPPKVEPISETVWVDKSRLLVTRVTSHANVTVPGENTPTHTESTITFTKLTLDDPVPDDAFVFTPPAGATEMDLGQFMPNGQGPK